MSTSMPVVPRNGSTPDYLQSALGGEDLRPDQRLYLQLCRAIDTPLAAMLLLASFLAMNVGQTSSRFDDFLALRITVKNLLMVIGFAVAWRLASSGWGLYSARAVKSRWKESFRVVGLCTMMSASALVFPAISVTGAFRPSTIVCFWLVSMAGLLTIRILLRPIAASRHRPVQETLIVGSGARAVKLFRRLQGDTEHRRVLGFVDSVDGPTADVVRERLLGSLDQLEGLLMHGAIDEVLITLPMRSRYNEIQEVIRVCERVGVRAKYLADIFEHARAAPRYDGLDSMPLVDMPVAADDNRLLIKRAIDVTGGLLGLIALMPVMLATAMAIKLTSRGPVLFAQKRYGRNRRQFKMYKFRTMVSNAEALQAQLERQNEVEGPVFKINRDPRITPVGKFLRRTSIDELPQLWNVLKGEMSLVGPRPLPVRDVHQFTQAALMRRFSVTPGLTCLWQISGRSTVRFDEWIRLDLQYIDEWSLGLDLEILAKTVPAVFKGTGAA
jgi:exopolysaccharide biosynthesis polyprenyl glycosylphosphotransferase